jgi:hypothetical protein
MRFSTLSIYVGQDERMFWYVLCSAVGLLENVQKTNNLNVKIF